MSGAGKVTVRTDIAGESLSSVFNIEDEVEAVFQRTLPAGKAGTVTTRTDNDTAVLTVASGHGITDADTVAVFWAGGSRRTVDVTATTSTTISIDAGAGDNLPVLTTAVVVSKQEAHSLPLIGDDLSLLAIECENRGMVDFIGAGPASLLHYDILAGEGPGWTVRQGHTNPLAGDVVETINIANGGTSSVTLKIGTLVNTN